MREKIFSSKTARRKRKERKGKTHLFSFSCSVMSNSLQSHELQHARLLCISPSPGVCANSCPLSQWCQPNILSSAIPFSSCLQSFPASGLFQWVSFLHQVAKVLELQLQHQSFQWIFRTDFLYDWLVWSPCSLRDSQGSLPGTQFKSINSSALSLLYGPTFTSVHDHWKNHTFDWLYGPLSAKWYLCFLICCLGLS